MTLTKAQINSALTSATQEGRGEAFIATQNAITSVAIVKAAIENLATLAGIRQSAIIAGLVTKALPKDKANAAKAGEIAKTIKATDTDTPAPKARAARAAKVEIPVEAAPAFTKDQPVMARFEDGKRYGAVVVSVRGDTATITWDDGSGKAKVPVADLTAKRVAKAETVVPKTPRAARAAAAEIVAATPEVATARRGRRPAA